MRCRYPRRRVSTPPHGVWCTTAPARNLAHHVTDTPRERAHDRCWVVAHTVTGTPLDPTSPRTAGPGPGWWVGAPGPPRWMTTPKAAPTPLHTGAWRWLRFVTVGLEWAAGACGRRPSSHLDVEGRWLTKEVTVSVEAGLRGMGDPQQGNHKDHQGQRAEDSPGTRKDGQQPGQDKHAGPRHRRRSGRRRSPAGGDVLRHPLGLCQVPESRGRVQPGEHVHGHRRSDRGWIWHRPARHPDGALDGEPDPAAGAGWSGR